MTSWANRGNYRKPNLSHVPQELQHHFIRREEQSLFVLSESFQKKEVNEIIYPDEKPSSESVWDRRQYPIKKIESIIQPSAVELIHNDKSYVFVILRNIQLTKDNDLWISSYNSIRRFYTNPIVIIDDNSSINTVNGKLVNTEIIQSEWNGAGEILPYYYFLRYKWADRMIFLHDSMFLHRPFRPLELEGAVRFHWHFENTEVRDDRKISTYFSFLPRSEDLIAFLNESNTKWKGCFGGASIIDFEVVDQLEQKYEFISKLVTVIRTRKDRETFERVFGLVLYYEKYINESNCSNFGNIVQYPNAFQSQHQSIDTSAHQLSQARYDTAIIKVWRGR